MKKIGDYIDFKCDIEQSGRIVKIQKERRWGEGLVNVYTVEPSGEHFEGEYIRDCKTVRLVRSSWSNDEDGEFYDVI